jgi:hypothetical protein
MDGDTFPRGSPRMDSDGDDGRYLLNYGIESIGSQFRVVDLCICVSDVPLMGFQ